MTNDAWEKLFESPAYIFFGWFALQIFIGWVLADIGNIARLPTWARVLAWPVVFTVCAMAYWVFVGGTLALFMTLKPTSLWAIVQDDPLGFLEFALNAGAEFGVLILFGALAWLIRQTIKFVRSGQTIHEDAPE